MKKILLYIGIAIVAIGCTKELAIDNSPTDEAISFTAGVTTRVSSSNDCMWSDGIVDAEGDDSYTDQIGIFTNQTGDSQNIKFEISDASTGTMAACDESVSLYPLANEEGPRTYYAYHPFNEDQDTEISYDLTKGYDNYLLWATETTNDTEVALQFTHMLPKVTFNLIISNTGAEATAWLSGASSAATFDITSGEFASTATDDIPLTLVTLGDYNYNYVTAYLIPMAAVAGNVTLYIKVDEVVYAQSISTTAWEIGNSYVYNITVGEQSLG